MLIYLLVLLAFVIAALLIPERTANPKYVRDMQMKIHPYSGLNPDLYTQYINNLELFEENINNVDVASEFLYNAIDSAEELKLYGNTDFNSSIQDVAITGESLLMKYALKNGDHFYPKYLHGGIQD